MQWLSTFSTNAHTKFVRYKTGGHGVEMFAAHPELPATIVDWVTIAVRSPNVATAKGRRTCRRNAVFLTRSTCPAPRQLTQLYAAASAKKSEWPGGFRVGPQSPRLRSSSGRRQKGRDRHSQAQRQPVPNSPNVYDSLGDAYLADGRTIWRGRMRRRRLSCWRTTPPIREESAQGNPRQRGAEAEAAQPAR